MELLKKLGYDNISCNIINNYIQEHNLILSEDPEFKEYLIIRENNIVITNISKKAIYKNKIQTNEPNANNLINMLQVLHLVQNNNLDKIDMKLRDCKILFIYMNEKNKLLQNEISELRKKQVELFD